MESGIDVSINWGKIACYNNSCLNNYSPFRELSSQVLAVVGVRCGFRAEKTGVVPPTCACIYYRFPLAFLTLTGTRPPLLFR